VTEPAADEPLQEGDSPPATGRSEPARELARRFEGPPPLPVTDGESLSDVDRDLTDALSARDDRALKKKYAEDLLQLLKWILGAGFVILAYYLVANHGHVPGRVMEVFLASLVAGVIGLVAIVVHYLFPRRDR
jgi:hypothetical protein